MTFNVAKNTTLESDFIFVANIELKILNKTDLRRADFGGNMGDYEIGRFSYSDF